MPPHASVSERIYMEFLPNPPLSIYSTIFFFLLPHACSEKQRERESKQENSEVFFTLPYFFFLSLAFLRYERIKYRYLMCVYSKHLCLSAREWENYCSCDSHLLDFGIEVFLSRRSCRAKKKRSFINENLYKLAERETAVAKNTEFQPQMHTKKKPPIDNNANRSSLGEMEAFRSPQKPIKMLLNRAA
jgi:hypothetical protein